MATQLDAEKQEDKMELISSKASFTEVREDHLCRRCWVKYDKRSSEKGIRGNSSGLCLWHFTACVTHLSPASEISSLTELRQGAFKLLHAWDPLF